MFCVVCGFESDSVFASVCEMCAIASSLTPEQLATYVPSVCGDDVCYLDFQGMPNFDGECEHEDEFYTAVGI